MAIGTMNAQVDSTLFDEQVEFGRQHPKFKQFIPTIMSIHTMCQAGKLGGRVPGPLEAYEHIFEGKGATKKVKCNRCANELATRMEQRKQYQ